MWIEEEYGKLSMVEEPGEVIRPRDTSGWSTAVVPLPTPGRVLVVDMLDVDWLRDIALWTSVSMVLSDLHICCLDSKWGAHVTLTVSGSSQGAGFTGRF